MKIQIKRVYDEPSRRDGTRVLVDRLWPRGLSKEDASLHVWAHDLAPSTSLRKWFGHDPARYDRFAERYRGELKGNRAGIDKLIEQIDRRKPLTLLYASKDTTFNHAKVLQVFLKEVL